MSDERGMYPLEVERPEKASQSLLAKISDCPFSGGLYLKHRHNGVQDHAQARGEAIHFAIEQITERVRSGEWDPDVPPEVAKDTMQAVLDERTDLAMSPKEHDACRAALWNWGVENLLAPDRIVGIEEMLELELAGWTIRGKIDRAEIADGDGFVYDYKTGLYLPSAEDFEQDFQQQFYGLLLLEGVPEGESVPLGRGLNGVHLNGHYPRIARKDGDGRVVGYYTRHAYKDRAQIHDFRRTVESALAKLDHGLETGEWKASPGSHCDFCPARSECPIPEASLPPQIATEGQAMEACERLIVLDNEKTDVQGSVKAWLSENGEVEVGGYAFSLKPTAQNRGDHDAIKQALKTAGYDPADFYTESTSTRFTKKRIKEAA